MGAKPATEGEICAAAKAAISSCRADRHVQTLRNFEILLTPRLEQVKVRLACHLAMPGAMKNGEAATGRAAEEAASLLLGLARYLEGRR